MKYIDTKLVHLDNIVEATHIVNKYKKVYYTYVKDKKILFSKLIMLKKLLYIKRHWNY